MPASRKERSMLASIAANERWAQTADRSEATKPARDGLTAKFEKMVDPEGMLPPEERARRVASARKAHMTRLALRSAQSRRTAATRRQKEGDRERKLREVLGTPPTGATWLDEIRKVVYGAPPLTEEQRNRLAMLLD